MSKASEYALLVQAAKAARPPVLFTINIPQKKVAFVCDDGGLSLESVVLNKNEAMALLAWMKDVYEN